MNKRYIRIEKDIAATQDQIDTKKQLLSDAETRLKNTGLIIAGLRRELKKAVIGEDKELIQNIESQVTEQEKLIGRDRILIQGTKEIIEELTKKLSALIFEKNELFKTLAAEWLKEEIKGYDELAIQIKAKISRFLTCFEFLRDIEGGQDIYRNTIGEAFRFLPLSKIHNIKDFCFSHTRSFNIFSYKDSVMKEIVS